MTAREALAWATVHLTQSGMEDGRRAAQVLLAEASGLDGGALLLGLDQPLCDSASAAFCRMVERAACGEPMQYILGHWDFYGRTFQTDRRALIPRPETERLVEEALKAIPPGNAADVIDVGCGTGCIGITLKLERPFVRIALCDLSDDALALARENAAALRAGVTFRKADMRLPLPGGPYDVIASNPPYINGEDMAKLSANVRDHEPELALYGGEDGLDFVRALADRAGDSLKPGGTLLIEIGYDQAGQALEIMKTTGMHAQAIADYSGVLRVIVARKGL